MYNGKTFLAIIPARIGSKRLPRKNLIDLGGKPLIAWSIEAAIKSAYIDEVLVTTDSKDISEVAKLFGAQVPFVRPKHLAGDTATTFDVVEHAIDFYRDLGKSFDYAVLLQPTSPLRMSTHIDDAIVLLNRKKANAVISVTEMEHSPLWSNVLPSNGDMKNFIIDEVKNKRSQDLPIHFRLNGAIYICDTDKLIAEKSFFISDKIYSFIMSNDVSIDIDTKHDYELAKFTLSRSKLNQN